MTKVTILPISDARGDISYHAVAGEKRSEGHTAGEALDALTTQLSDDETGTLIILQNLKPDQYFSEVQRTRLTELMTRRRAARDKAHLLPQDEQTELDALMEAELQATETRAKEMSGKTGRR